MAVTGGERGPGRPARGPRPAAVEPVAGPGSTSATWPCGPTPPVSAASATPVAGGGDATATGTGTGGTSPGPDGGSASAGGQPSGSRSGPDGGQTRDDQWQAPVEPAAPTARRRTAADPASGGTRPAPRRPGLTPSPPPRRRAMTTVSGTGATTGTSTTTGTGTSATDPARSSTLDQDTFLKLLVAQLKYQDPSSPSDPTQFMSETAQFTVVQKLDALSTLDQKVLDATHAQTAAGADRPDGHVHRLLGQGPHRHRHRHHLRQPEPDAHRRRAARRARRRHRRRHRRAGRHRLTRARRPPTSRPHHPTGTTPAGHRHGRRPTASPGGPRAPLPLLRHHRPAPAPDADGRRGQQHRQRQHGRLQEQLGRVRGHPQPDGEGRRPRPPPAPAASTPPRSASASSSAPSARTSPRARRRTPAAPPTS